MKFKLCKTIFLCSFVLLLSGCRTTSIVTPNNMRYEIECAGNGVQGTYLLKVWVYGSEKGIDIDYIKHCAVHGVIFKGFAGGNGCPSQRPMASSPALEQQRNEFFTPFFGADKAYRVYASEVGGGLERVKVGKELKIGAVISVSKDMLRRDLEAAGIIRGLNTGF